MTPTPRTEVEKVVDAIKQHCRVYDDDGALDAKLIAILTEAEERGAKRKAEDLIEFINETTIDLCENGNEFKQSLLAYLSPRELTD